MWSPLHGNILLEHYMIIITAVSEVPARFPSSYTHLFKSSISTLDRRVLPSR